MEKPGLKPGGVVLPSTKYQLLNTRGIAANQIRNQLTTISRHRNKKIFDPARFRAELS
jgi:hypothetical protein